MQNRIEHQEIWIFWEGKIKKCRNCEYQVAMELHNTFRRQNFKYKNKCWKLQKNHEHIDIEKIKSLLQVILQRVMGKT